MTELKLKKWDVVEQLKTDEDMALYLDACMEEDPGDGSLIPVSEITEDTVLIAPLGAAASTIGIGKKFKLHTDAASVGAAAGGCLEVASFDGKAVGDLVIFRVVDADPTTSS